MSLDISSQDKALAQVRDSSSSNDSGGGVTFTIRLCPYQLNPELPDSTSKKDWYLKERFFDNADAFAAYQASISGLLEPLDVKLRFDGDIGNTFEAHRVLQLLQKGEDEGNKGKDQGEIASRVLDGLYRRYLCEAMHPTAEETIVGACVEAGVPEARARELFREKSQGEQETKMKLRESARDVDAVPVVTVEGKRRDITLTGAKEVKDYVKALETVIKESS